MGDIAAETAVSDGYAAVADAVQSVYPCLGITCEDVGGLLANVTLGNYYPGLEPCLNQIVGYTPGTSVVPHSMIDVDQDAMNTAAAGGDFYTAAQHYALGGASVKSSGAIRTLRGFSTGLDRKACPSDPASRPDATVDEHGCIEPLFSMYKSYYNSPTYADDIVSAALSGTGDYTGLPEIGRKEIAVKGSAYMNVWMYAIHEMEDAILDCHEGETTSGVHAWDEFVAFYAGSLEGASVGGSPAGEMPYRLAEKRCANFGTCGPDGVSQVNTAVLAASNAGRDLLAAGDCDGAALQMELIKKQITIPLIQGMLRYAYKADPNGGAGASSTGGVKELAEGHIFAKAVLPQIAECDLAAAATIERNFDPVTPVVDGYATVFESVQSVYHCLGLVCEDIGTLLEVDSPPECTCRNPYDGNTDGIVNIYDLLQLLGYFNVVGC